MRREDVEYLNWRDKVFKRDAYTCQFCGTKGGAIEAHHMNSHNTHPKQRTKTSNGVTLCFSHHEMFHDKYGKGNNTKKQFDEFMKKRTYKSIVNLMKRLF